MISVIVPVYNVFEFIDKCLKSIINQTYKDIEIIIIDDGSNDGSSEKCFEWSKKDNRIIFIKKKNEGQGNARNIGISIAKGEYLIFVDSDDYIAEDMIQKLYNAASLNNSEIVLCNSYAVFLDNKNRVEQTIKFDNKKLILEKGTNVFNKKELLVQLPMVLWGCIIKKKIFIENNIKMPDFSTEDAAIMPLVFLAAENIYKIDDFLYYYTNNRINSTMNSVKPFYDGYKSFDFIYKHFYEKDLKDMFYKQLCSMFIRRMNFMKKNYLKLVNNDEFKDTLKKYTDFLNDKFKGWNEKKNILLWGSENLLNVISVQNRIIDFYNEQCFKNDRKLDYADYIVIDFLEENCLLDFNSDIYRNNCISLINNIKKVFKPNQVVLIKNYFTFEFIKDDKRNYFTDKEKILILNNNLDKAYKLFIENFEGINVIEFEKNSLFYTDFNYPGGCLPCYYNDYLYDYIGDKLIDVF